MILPPCWPTILSSSEAQRRVFDKNQIIDNLQAKPRIRRSLVDFKTLPRAPGLILATYRAIRHGDPGEQLF